MARVVRVPLEAIVEGERVLSGETARYVSRVHRLGAGDSFVVFDPERGIEAPATLLSTSKREVRCRVGEIAPGASLGVRPVTLLQALGKGDKPDQVIRDATALGATRVVIVETARTVPKVGARRADRGERYRRIAVESARQCGRGDVPRIDGPLPLVEALSDPSGARRYCLDPDAEQSLAVALGEHGGGAVELLVGPEGGFTPEERLAIDAAGFERVALGPFVLRTEVAAVAALAVVAGVAPTDEV